MTFGCPPSQSVLAKSDISVSYFKFINDKKNERGEFKMPDMIGYFRGPDGQCETVANVSKPILFQWAFDFNYENVPQDSEGNDLIGEDDPTYAMNKMKE